MSCKTYAMYKRNKIYNKHKEYPIAWKISNLKFKFIQKLIIITNLLKEM